MFEVTTTRGTLTVHELGSGPIRRTALHGFTLTGESFARVAAHLEGTTLAPDLPGHGATRLAPIDLDTTIRALAALGERYGPTVLLGYSQGGRLAANMVSRRPDLVDRLVMISASTGLEAGERRARAASDAERAAQIGQMDIAAVVDEWLSQPLTRPHGIDRKTREWDRGVRLANTSAGLAASLRGFGQGALPRVDPASLGVPTLWIAGQSDAAYTDRLRRDATSAGGEYIQIAECGHNVVLEQPEALARTIAGWESSIGG